MSSSSINQRILAKLQKRNQEESVPFAALVELSNRLLVTNANLASEREQFEFVNSKLKEENQRLIQKSASESELNNPAAQEQVSALEKKLFLVQEELTELHRRKGQNAQQIIDQSAQMKVLEGKIADLESKLLAADLQFKEDSAQKAKLKAIITEVESTNQLLKDEYQTLQLALSTAERKLLESKKENDQLVNQIMEFKERDVLRLNQENDKALRMQQERIKQQLEEAVAETSKASPSSASSSSVPKFSNFFRLGQDQQSPGREHLDSAICHSVRIPTRCFLKFEAHDNGDVNAIKWSPHGLTVATGGADRKVKVWDISKNMVEQRGTLSGSNGAVFSLDYDSSGSLLLAASSDFASRIWSVDDQRLRHTLTGHSNKVLSAKFIDPNKVVSASYDRTIKVWDLRSKACIGTKFPGSSCNDIVHSDNNVISAHFDKKVRFWDLRKGGTDPIEEIELGGKVTSLDISKNGLWLLACCRDDSLRLIDLRSCQLTSKVFATEGFQVACDWARATFTPDSEFVSVGAANGKIYIWRLDNCVNPEKVLSEHSSPVVSLAWQPAGNSLTSCDKNKTVVVWAAI